MRITASEIVNETVDPNNGSRTITERHTYDTGQAWLYSYIAGADWDIQSIMNQRATNVNADLERKDQQSLEASNFEVPLSIEEIINRFTLAELGAFYASNAAGMDVVKNIVAAWKGPIFRNHQRTLEMFGIIEASGVLTAQRIAEILA